MLIDLCCHGLGKVGENRNFFKLREKSGNSVWQINVLSKTFTKELISLASSLSSLFFKTSLWSVKSRGNVQEFLLQ